MCIYKPQNNRRTSVIDFHSVTMTDGETCPAIETYRHD